MTAEGGAEALWAFSNHKILEHFRIPVFDPDQQELIAKYVHNAYQARTESAEAFITATQLLEAELGLDKMTFQKQVSYTALASDLANSTRRADAEYYSPVARAIVKRIRALPHTSVSESFNVQSGFPWNSKKFLSDNSGEPVVRIRNIKPNHVIPGDLTSIYPPYANSAGVAKARRGDVVVGMDGVKYFYASVLEGECFVNQRVCHLSPRSSGTLSAEYSAFMINSAAGQAQLMRDMTVATTVGHITNRDVAKLIVPTVSQSFHNQITALMRKSIDGKEKSRQLLGQAKARVDQLIKEAVQL